MILPSGSTETVRQFRAALEADILRQQKETGGNQAEVSAKLGYSPQQLSGLKKGRGVSISTMEAYAAKRGTSLLSMLLEGEAILAGRDPHAEGIKIYSVIEGSKRVRDLKAKIHELESVINCLNEEADYSGHHKADELRERIFLLEDRLHASKMEIDTLMTSGSAKKEAYISQLESRNIILERELLRKYQEIQDMASNQDVAIDSQVIARNYELETELRHANYKIAQQEAEIITLYRKVTGYTPPADIPDRLKKANTPKDNI